MVGADVGERVGRDRARPSAVDEHVGDVVAGVRRVIVKVWLAPAVYRTGPAGAIAPPAPAEAVIVKASMGEGRAMVWPAVTLVNV